MEMHRIAISCWIHSIIMASNVEYYTGHHVTNAEVIYYTVTTCMAVKH